MLMLRGYAGQACAVLFELGLSGTLSHMMLRPEAGVATAFGPPIKRATELATSLEGTALRCLGAAWWRNPAA